MPRKPPPLQDTSEPSPLGPDPTHSLGGKLLPKMEYLPVSQKVKNSLTSSKGGSGYDHHVLETYKQLSVTKQGDALRRQWSSIAKILADKIERAAPNLTKKDWYYFKSLLVSGGVAYDKAFPDVETMKPNNLIVNMFGSLGTDVVAKVLRTSALPVLDLTPTEVELVAQPPSTNLQNFKGIMGQGRPSKGTSQKDTSTDLPLV